MTAGRWTLEFLLLAALQMTRIAHVAAGLALLSASLIAAGTIHSPGDPLIWIRWLGIALGVGGVLLFVARSWIRIPRTPDSDAQAAFPSWLGLVPIALLGQAVTAGVFSAPLFSLWRESLDFLNRSGLFEEFHASQSMSGIVFFPVFAVLCVPALEAATALWLIVGPLVLVGLFLTKSRIFPRGLVMTAIAQASLVFGGLLAAHTFSLLLPPVLTEVLKTPGPEAKPVAAALTHVRDVIAPTAGAHAWILIASLVWIPGMVFSKAMGTIFTRGSRAT